MVLEKEDSFLLKGWSIAIIVLHNFLHNIKQLPSQNEFNYSIDKARALVDVFVYNPSDIIRALLSFYGHYGVKIFIFLSAYGLTRIYLVNDIKIKAYILRHFTKIYKAFFLVLIYWVVYELLVNQVDLRTMWSNHSEAVVYKLLGINIPGFALAPVGPWWFIPAIIQLYLLFPLLLFLFKKYGSWFLLLLSVLVYLILGLVDKKILFFNAFGHLPEFCLGIYLASKGSYELKWPIIVLAFVGFVLSHFHAVFWLFSGVSITILVLALYGNRTEKQHSIMISIGKLSLYMFLINGFMRKPFLDWARGFENDWLILGFSLVFLVLVVLTAKLLSSIKKPFQLGKGS